MWLDGLVGPAEGIHGRLGDGPWPDGISDDGNRQGDGGDSSGDATVVFPVQPGRVSAGGQHVCVVEGDGKVHCWLGRRLFRAGFRWLRPGSRLT